MLSPLLLSFLLGAASAGAFEPPANEADARALHARIESGWAKDPLWRNAGMNRYRDGKPSTYVTSADSFPSQSDPMSAAELAALPDARFVPFDLFWRAVRGLRSIAASLPGLGIRKDLLTIVDFDQPTESRRFLVLDLASERVLFQTWVTHGAGSDQDSDRVPESFSNVDDSYQSSLGFYLTERGTYRGNYGHSVRLHGIDGALNSRVHSRAIVMHPWESLHAAAMAKHEADATLGCLGLPYFESGKFFGGKDVPLSRLIIDRLAGRTVLFVHSSTVDLARKSLYLRDGGKVPGETARRVRAQVLSEERLSDSSAEATTWPERSR
jgi:hypothetical protein